MQNHNSCHCPLNKIKIGFDSYTFVMIQECVNHQRLEAFKMFIAENLTLIVVVIIYYLVCQKLKVKLVLVSSAGTF